MTKEGQETHKRLESSSSGNEQEERLAEEVGDDTKTTFCRSRIEDSGSRVQDLMPAKGEREVWGLGQREGTQAARFLAL